MTLKRRKQQQPARKIKHFSIFFRATRRHYPECHSSVLKRKLKIPAQLRTQRVDIPPFPPHTRYIGTSIARPLLVRRLVKSRRTNSCYIILTLVQRKRKRCTIGKTKTKTPIGAKAYQLSIALILWDLPGAYLILGNVELPAVGTAAAGAAAFAVAEKIKPPADRTAVRTHARTSRAKLCM